MINIILLSGDIEFFPRASSILEPNIFHWNLKSIPVDNFIKMPLLESYITTSIFYVFCLSDTFLKSSISDNYESLNLLAWLST